MGPDVVEIALDSMTDATGFEKLAAEIMSNMGYPRIVPLGGVHDLGRDAIQEHLCHCDDRIQTVLQFTLSADITSKATTTIKKLAKHNVKYDELVLVTSASVSAERHDALVAKCRKDHAVSLRIYDRKVLVNKLANFRNGIFDRYFPDIEKQVRGLLERRTRGLPPDELLMRVRLTVCKAFVLHEGAGRARKELLDNVVTSILLAGGQDGLSFSDLSSSRDRQLGAGVINDSQLSACLDRLCRAGVAVREQEQYHLSEESLNGLAQADFAVDAEETSVVQDLVDNVADVSDASITPARREQLESNAHALLAEFFRLFGLELSDQFLRQGEPRPVYREGLPHLVNLACQGVPHDLGHALLGAVGEALARPSASQAQFFACYARAYLALAVLNLDPTLRELQLTRMRTKAFILDTDVVLDCIISEAPRGGLYPRIVETLREAGCRAIVPRLVLSEVANHAKIAPRTYRHVEHSLLDMPEALVREEVGNAFVRGYYYAKTRAEGSWKGGFGAYLANYWEPSEPERFLAEVIQNKLPGVEIVAVEDLLGQALSVGQVGDFVKCFLDIELKKPKAGRTETEMTELAVADAKLLATVIALNRKSQVGEGVLGRDVFLVTNSGRHLSCMKTLGIRERVTSRPQVLMGVLELVGRCALSDREFVSLFENPVLQYAIGRIWGQVRVLLDAGLDLRECSLTRLGWDLDRGLSAKITNLSEAEACAEASVDDTAERQAGLRYVELLDDARARGYPATPVVEELQREKAALERALEELSEKHADLEKAVTFFGRRRQRYLRRVQGERRQGGAASDGA